MLSWKSLSLIVAAAVAMSGVSGLEQGNPANVPKHTVAPSDSPVQSASPVPSWTTATPTATTNEDSYSFGSTGSSIAGSSTIDEGSDAIPTDKVDITVPPSSGSTSSSGSGSEYNPKRPPTFPISPKSPSSSGSGSLPGTPTGSQSEGSSGIDEGSDVGKQGLRSLSGSGSSPAGSTGLDEGSDYTTSEAGSDVEGSKAIDEGSDSVPNDKGAKTIPPSTSVPEVPTGSEGSTGIGEGSSSQPGSKVGDVEFPSGSGSEGNGSGDISQGSSSQPTGKGDGIPRSGDGSQTQASTDGSTRLDKSSASGSEPCDEPFELPGGSEDGSKPEGSAGLDEGSYSAPSGDGNIAQSSETGSRVAGSSDIDQGSDASSPNQTDDSTANESSGSAGTPSSSETTGSKVAGSSDSEPTFPSVKTSCKQRLRQ